MNSVLYRSVAALTKEFLTTATGENMGYNTEFRGTLQFVGEPTTTQLAALTAMFGEDCRDHPDWGTKNASYIDLKIADDFTGIQWDDGCEKTYGLEESVNVVIREMRKQWPDFALTGQLLAQGEDIEDRWALVIGDDGFATKQPLAMSGKAVTCPHCEKRFVLE